MAARTLPGIGLIGFWDLGFNGWKDEHDRNLLVLSVLAGAQVLDLLATLPGSPTNGDIYLLDATAGADANKLCIRDVGAWVKIVPKKGAILYDLAADFHRWFDGTDWVELVTGGGGGGDLLAANNLSDVASVGTARSNLSVYSQAQVDSAIAAAVTGLLDFKGSTDCSADPNYPAASKGDAYVVSVAGKIGGASGTAVDIGDVYVANADNAGGTQAAVGTSWFLLEHNLAGALLAANNLSDIANAAAARANLGAKAVNPAIQSVASSATVTPTFSDDQVNITAQAAGLTLANPTGTAVDGWGIAVRIKDNGTARSIAYGSQYRAIGITLPTTTVLGKTLYLGMIYNAADTKWDVVAVAQEA